MLQHCSTAGPLLRWCPSSVVLLCCRVAGPAPRLRAPLLWAPHPRLIDSSRHQPRHHHNRCQPSQQVAFNAEDMTAAAAAKGSRAVHRRAAASAASVTLAARNWPQPQQSAAGVQQQRQGQGQLRGQGGRRGGAGGQAVETFPSSRLLDSGRVQGRVQGTRSDGDLGATGLAGQWPAKRWPCALYHNTCFDP